METPNEAQHTHTHTDTQRLIYRTSLMGTVGRVDYIWWRQGTHYFNFTAEFHCFCPQKSPKKAAKNVKLARRVAKKAEIKIENCKKNEEWKEEGKKTLQQQPKNIK